jgi:competence ComEA-like helix-hairpin-helix protein
MNLQPSNRRQDLPVRLGSHGYRIDGDYALLNAELHLPPYFSEQGFGLELWACPGPHAGGSPEGIKIAEIPLELPTPIGAYLHRVEARAALTPPPGEGEHSMVLVLVGGAGEARRVHDFANYSNLQLFHNPRFEGAVAYGIEGDEVLISAESVLNPRSEGNTSGSLTLELWASSEPYVSGAPRGHRLAGAELGSIYGQYVLPDVARRTAFAAPPPGQWYVALLLREWTVAQGYVTRDARVFDLKYEQAAPVAVAPVAVAPVAVAPVAVAPVAVAPVAVAPVAVAPVAVVPAVAAKPAAPVAPVAPVAAPAAAAPSAAAAPVAPVASSPLNGASVRPVDKLRLLKADDAPAPETSASAAPAVLAKAPAKAVEAKAPAAVEAKAPAAVDAKAPAAVDAKAPAAVEAKAPAAVEAKAPAAVEAKAPAAVEAKAPAAVEAKAPAAKVEAPATAAAKAPLAADAKTSAPATGATGKALLSVNTASVEELSRLPGLSLKVAKEIVKNRPFASVDALVDVRGVGEKTLRRIKSLLAL